MIAAVVAIVAIFLAAGWRRSVESRRILVDALESETRAHGDLRDKHAKMKVEYDETEPKRASARFALALAQETQNNTAARITSLRRENKQLRLFLAQAIRRGELGSVEAARLIAAIEGVLGHEMNSDPEPEPEAISPEAIAGAAARLDEAGGVA